jgi:hypothetical protein
MLAVVYLKILKTSQDWYELLGTLTGARWEGGRCIAMVVKPAFAAAATALECRSRETWPIDTAAASCRFRSRFYCICNPIIRQTKISPA